MRLAVASVLLLGGCFAPSIPDDALFRCATDADCAARPGYLCDDQVCCRPEGDPVCRTQVLAGGHCADGGTAQVYYEDLDGDGIGNLNLPRYFCARPYTLAVVPVGGDCNDNPVEHGAEQFPEHPEVCDGLDNDCDGETDERPCCPTYFADADGDGYGDPAAAGVQTCDAGPVGSVANALDCAPADPAIHPGAVEACNGRDDDCNGVIDDGLSPLATFSRDGDGDGFGTPDNQLVACAAPVGYVTPATDCDDTNKQIKPGARDVCDGVDNDCDGAIDQAPDCGGPANLLSPGPGATRGAQITSYSGASGYHCERVASPPASNDALTGATWTGSGTNDHITYVIAPSGAGWDLTKPNARLRLKLSASVSGATSGTNPWNPFNQPLVSLCGANGTWNNYIHAGPLLDANPDAVDQAIPLGGGGGWILATGGLNLKDVRWIEVMVQTDVGTTPFTITFQSFGFEVAP